MKKSFFSLSILSLAILVSSSYSASAVSYAAPVKIFLNDTFLKTDVEPIIVNGRTLVPIRNLAEALSLSIEYNGTFGEIYLRTPDYKPSTITVPDNINEILQSISGNNLLNLDVSQILRAIDIGKNFTAEEVSNYVYILPTIHEGGYNIDNLFGIVTIDTPFIEIVRQANINPDYDINSALNYLKKYYLTGQISFSFTIYGNGENFYKNASISLIQNSNVIDKIYIKDSGILEKNNNDTSPYANAFSGTVKFDFPKIDFSKPAELRFDYIDGIGKSFFIDFNEYL